MLIYVFHPKYCFFSNEIMAFILKYNHAILHNKYYLFDKSKIIDNGFANRVVFMITTIKCVPLS